MQLHRLKRITNDILTEINPTTMQLSVAIYSNVFLLSPWTHAFDLKFDKLYTPYFERVEESSRPFSSLPR